MPISFDRNDAYGDESGLLVDTPVEQGGGQVGDVDSGIANAAVDQQPVVRSKRNRKPNSKYDPAVYDLDLVEMRGIPLSGKKNGWKGVYWPK